MSYQSVTDFLLAFLSNDNNVRKQAESFLDQLQSTNTLQALQFLISGLDLAQTEHAELSALLLKKRFLDNAETLKSIPKDALLLTVSKAKSLIAPEKRLLLLMRLAEIIVVVHTFLDDYNELMTLITGLETLSQSSNIKKLTLYFIEILCDYSFEEELLVQFSGPLTALFEKYLSDAEIQVRVAAIKSLTIFLSYITDEKFVKKFAGIFPILLSTAVEAIKIDEEAGKVSLESLNDLIETHPKFIKPIINDLIILATEIFSAKNLNESLRNTALNIILSISLENQSLVRKSEEFKTRTIPALIQTMVEVESVDEAEWNKDLEENCLSQNSPAATAQDILGKLAPELGVKFLFPNFMPYIKQTLESNQWQFQYAGLMAIGLLAEGSAKHFKTELENIMAIIAPLMNSTNPRVIYALLTSIALLCSEFTPEIQTKFHNIILPYIIAQMKNQTFRKIQIRAVSSIMNFCRELMNHEQESKLLLHYTDEIMSCLMNLFTASLNELCYPLQEEILNVLSMVAVVIGESFSTYYTVFMPGLKQLLMNLPATTPKQVTIRTLTIECIGFLVSSIKNNTALFVEDLNLIMKFLTDLECSGQLIRDDPHHQAIISVYAQFSSCLRENFATFLPSVVPSVLKALDIHVDFDLQDETKVTEKQPEKKMAQAVFDMKMLGGKKILSVNTDALEIKINAANAIYALSKNTKKAFLPYVSQTKAVIEKYLDYKYSREIRKCSLKTIHWLLMACETETQMAEVLGSLMPLIVKEARNIVKIENHEELHLLLKQLVKCFRYFKSPLVNLETVIELLNVSTDALKLQETLKSRTMNDYEDVQEDCDDDQKEDFKGEYEAYNDLMQISMELTGSLVKLYKTNVEGLIFTNIVPYYYKALTNAGATENEQLYAICLFDDVLENCSVEPYNKAVADILTIFINIFKNTKNQDLIQSLVYGFGVFAKRTPVEIFSPFYLTVVQAILSVIENEKAFTPESIVCTECAIGALGKVALYQSTTEGKVRNEILGKFLSMLPLKNEPEEAQSVHKMVLAEILNKNEVLLDGSFAEGVKKTLEGIKVIASSNPELEILDDQGKEMMQQIVV